MAFMIELLPEGAEETELLHVVEDDDAFWVADVSSGAGELIVIKDNLLHDRKAMGHIHVIPIESDSEDFEAELTDDNRVVSIPAGWRYEQDVQIPVREPRGVLFARLIIQHYINPNVPPDGEVPFAGN